jgi:hypothetical protein
VHTTTICMLNPLTRNLIQLPPLSTLVPSEDHDDILPERDHGLSLKYDFKAWGSGIAKNDDSTVVLCPLLPPAPNAWDGQAWRSPLDIARV